MLPKYVGHSIIVEKGIKIRTLQMSFFIKIKNMKTHKEILSAIRTLADYEPLEIKINFRGYDVVYLDAHDIQAYEVGDCNLYIIQWDEVTPKEALRLKRACRHSLDRMQQDAERRISEAEIRLTQFMRLRETFEKSAFGR